MLHFSETAPFPAPLPPKNRKRHDHKTRKNSRQGYILILQDDYLKVTFLNCLTGSGCLSVGAIEHCVFRHIG